MSDTDSRNPFVEREITDAIRRQAFSELEKIPEMRHLMEVLVRERAELARISESFNLLSDRDMRKLFSDYIEEKFDFHLHGFFGKIYNGLMSILKKTISTRLDVLEESMNDLKSSVLMASLHPYSWVNYEIEKAVMDCLQISPGMKAPLDTMCRYIIDTARVPIPGADRTERYRYVLGILRRMDRVREIEGFLFELLDHDVREEQETFATSSTHREITTLLASVCTMDANPDKIYGGLQEASD